ncbi:MAG: homogentisate 1,2-dioxygenase [Actinomycetota bacterium]|nr:homogentisate 1,2-dioxygenase [Actinomycetota bacterium]
MTELLYQSGFGNHFQTEALAGSLPRGQNSPQKGNHGLYTEQLSGSAFTAPREEQRRSWLYRIRPSVQHLKNLVETNLDLIKTGPDISNVSIASPLRWDPFPQSSDRSDWLSGLSTIATNGDAALQLGGAVHHYVAALSMVDTVFVNTDGELMFVPYEGALLLKSEMGDLEVSPGDLAVIPRGVKFSVDLATSHARGYVCENYGEAFRLPESGLMGINTNASARDFEFPVASFDNTERSTRIVTKMNGKFFETEIPHSPLDVVAWHGNLAPYRYELRNFSAIGPTVFDHPDPSIWTLLSSPSEKIGTANIDFILFREQWRVAENTFRPPWFHSNVMSELMGLIEGIYDAKAQGFRPGGGSLHNSFVPHGPDSEAFQKASNSELKPEKGHNSLAVMWESRYRWQPTTWAMGLTELQSDYSERWSGLPKKFI